MAKEVQKLTDEELEDHFSKASTQHREIKAIRQVLGRERSTRARRKELKKKVGGLGPEDLHDLRQMLGAEGIETEEEVGTPGG